MFDIEKKTNVDIIESQAGVKNDGFEQGNDDETVDLKAEPTHAMKLGSAIFYATASLAVIFANKTIMTAYQFPYVGFMAAISWHNRGPRGMPYNEKIELPPISWEIVRDILSVMFLGNILTGLGGTKIEFANVAARPIQHTIHHVVGMVGAREQACDKYTAQCSTNAWR